MTSENRGFKVGDKVKCIDLSGALKEHPHPELEKVYTVERLLGGDSAMLQLAELPESNSRWFAHRFVLVE